MDCTVQLMLKTNPNLTLTGDVKFTEDGEAYLVEDFIRKPVKIEL